MGINIFVSQVLSSKYSFVSVIDLSTLPVSALDAPWAGLLIVWRAVMWSLSLRRNLRITDFEIRSHDSVISHHWPKKFQISMPKLPIDRASRADSNDTEMSDKHSIFAEKWKLQMKVKWKVQSISYISTYLYYII